MGRIRGHVRPQARPPDTAERDATCILFRGLCGPCMGGNSGQAIDVKLRAELFEEAYRFGLDQIELDRKVEEL